MIALNRWRQRLAAARNWLIARAMFAILYWIQKLPPDRALAFLDRAARRIGPWSPRHRLALENLRMAFPGKSEADRQAIALDMWGNMARLLGEYVFMDQLFAHADEGPRHDRIDVEGAEEFIRLRDNPGPRIFFTAHLGNFELPPIVGAGYGLSISSLFRAPNNPFIASQLLTARATRMGGLVASRAGAALALARILDDGGSIGLLVDQKFAGGLPTTFFGRPCQTNPLLAKLARRADCPIHPVHCVRLPDGRFRLVLHEAIEPPRDKNGDVDVPALTQQINDVVENWVRADPGQWMWFHRRWEIRSSK